MFTKNHLLKSWYCSTHEHQNSPAQFVNPVRFVITLLLLNIVLLSGCPAQNSYKSKLKAETCFGIANGFSGHLTEYQERTIPESMHGAFYIEPLRNITEAELVKVGQKKMCIAKENRNGVRYVALRDLRTIQFDTFAAGLMVFIERYRIIDN